MQPANVAETTARIIESGIAHRMLVGSFQSHLPNDPSTCTFWVEVDEDGCQSVVVQYPPYGYIQHFGADPGESFGIGGQPPLTDAQQALVDRLAEEWRQTHATSG